MTIKKQLLTIQKQTAYTQEKLAQHLGVSFATLNSWINERSQPRKLQQGRINELYKTCTGEKTLSDKELNAKYESILAQKNKFKDPLAILLGRKDLFDQFMLSLTYHSNRIEGNTLTEDETAIVLFENHALPNRTLTEQIEVKNHQTALSYLWQNLRKEAISEDWVLKLHRILMNGIRDDAGCYRNHAVRIVGAYVPTANPLKVPDLMKGLFDKIKRKEKNALHHATAIHAEFEKIHPFSDGNGRIGRLLIHAMLLNNKFPPALIKETKRRLYYTYLRKAQMEEDSSLLEDFIMDSVLESYAIFV